MTTPATKASGLRVNAISPLAKTRMDLENAEYYAARSVAVTPIPNAVASAFDAGLRAMQFPLGIVSVRQVIET